MSTKREEQLRRLQDFLTALGKVKESGIIFSSTVLKRDVVRTVREHFDGKKLITLEETLGIKEKIDETFKESLRAGNPLFITVSAGTPAVVARRLEQLLKEGYLQDATPQGMKKLSPAEGWYALVWVDASALQDRDFALKELFGYKLVL
ncbi:MAG: hypothetical protein RDV48_12235 [Candidatus Eremiobacteraeota bacterium]|nr:hypothetical protein [Candidatus Eremiobacteraeota bacterium]